MTGEREELFCLRVAAGPRTYFLDIKRSREGAAYLVISEARRSESGAGYDHDRVMVFEEHLDGFAEAFEQALALVRGLPRRTPAAPPAASARHFPAPAAPEKAYDVTSIREQFPSAYAPWSDEDDARLRVRYLEGASVRQLVAEFGRKAGGIRSRLRKLGLDVRQPTTAIGGCAEPGAAADRGRM